MKLKDIENGTCISVGLILLSFLNLFVPYHMGVYPKSGILVNQSETRKVDKGQFDMFDTVQKKLYEMASKPLNQTSISERKQFTLDGWQRASGGLRDSDRLLLGELYYKSDSVFEFGLGESTQIAAHVGVPRYSGVDSDTKWVETARDSSNMDHFRFSFADIGETLRYGVPTNENLQKIQYNYQIAPLVVETKPFDFYLVDGRYRISCACVSFLHAMKHGGDMSKVMVAIHDYHRTAYHEIIKVGELVHHSTLLAVFKLKPNITQYDVFKVWEDFSLDKQR
mmetsp:Transcript_1715/g.2467  ORF Transcript_1715/g.2467 Transcript_1715/m.2467 type:complete len:281 (+) Transcript_1715:92-934(+)